MKRVVVLMTSQSAGIVFEKIRFDRFVKVDYFLVSQVEQSHIELKNKLKRATGFLVIVDSSFTEKNINLPYIGDNLKKHQAKIAVMLNGVDLSLDDCIIIRPDSNGNIDSKLIMYILCNGNNPTKLDWVGIERFLMKFVFPLLAILMLFFLIPLPTVDQNVLIWLTKNRWISILLGVLMQWIAIVNIYNAMYKEKKLSRKEISRIESFFNNKTDPNSDSPSQEEGNPNKQVSKDTLSENLMTYNLIALYRNINWGQRQAKVAFVFGIVFSICGLVVYCLPLILHKDFSNPDVASSVISPLVGGTISELIAATAMLIYSKSIKQLNYYHKALHENERFLSCINIIKCSECNKFDRIPMIDKVVSDYMKTGIEEQRASTKEEADD